jgi:hypothetical protein
VLAHAVPVQDFFSPKNMAAIMDGNKRASPVAIS